MELKSLDYLRLTMRMTERDVKVFVASEVDGLAQKELASRFGFSRQRVAQIVTRARVIIETWQEPSDEIAAKFPEIEAQAISGTGMVAIDQVIEAITEDRTPGWWPRAVLVSICGQLALPVPGSEADRDLTALLRMQEAHAAIAAEIDGMVRRQYERIREQAIADQARVDDLREREELIRVLREENPHALFHTEPVAS